MPNVPADFELQPGQRAMPVVWLTPPPDAFTCRTDTGDRTLEPIIGPGRGRTLRSFGHDQQGVHWLVTRAGTTVHTDTQYLRYSCQLVIRNDGNRLRGMPRLDGPPDTWHPPLTPGTMYCLDTHSPHQGLPDDRFPDRGRGVKVVIAVDRDDVLPPAQAWALLSPFLTRDLLADFTAYNGAAPRWRQQ